MRLRLVGALVILVLPLVAAAWAFGNYAAAHERSRTDTRLSAALRAAGSEYGRIVAEAQLQAVQLASRPAVQRALRERDRAALDKLERANPNVSFVIGTQPPPARPGAAQPSVKVLDGNKAVGTVVVDVVPNESALGRIADAAGLRTLGEIAAAVRGGRVIAASSPLTGTLKVSDGDPRTVVVGGESYRVVAGRLPSETGARLAVLEPMATVDSKAASIRDRVLLVGILVLAAVMLMAYALAPAIGRARFAQQQRAVAERVLAHVADGVLLLDEHGIVRFWNRAAERITGLTVDRVVGHRADDAIQGWQALSPQIPVVDAAEREMTPSSGIVPLETESRELWLAASAVRFSDGVVYSFSDISADERLDRAKTDFVATVSHELRTPLASVYGAALTLQQHFARLEKPQRDRLLELIAEESDRLSTIIDDILLASRLDSGVLTVEQEHFDAEQIARGVVQAARVRAPERIHIELSTPPWLPEATGDGDKVSQVLGNLVENAIKYSPEGGQIDVVLEHDDDRIRFEVRDEGLGIPLDEQERIFKKFYRLDPDLARGIGGTGLGLYICHELVRRMGGEIHVSSAPGKGSTFSFELPIAVVPDRLAVG